MPEINTVKGKKLIGASVKSSQGPASQAHWTVFYRFAYNAAILSDIPSVILSEGSRICVLEVACLLLSFITINSAIPVVLSDISSDILYEKPAACAKIGLL